VRSVVSICMQGDATQYEHSSEELAHCMCALLGAPPPLLHTHTHTRTQHTNAHTHTRTHTRFHTHASGKGDFTATPVLLLPFFNY